MPDIRAHRTICDLVYDRDADPNAILLRWSPQVPGDEPVEVKISTAQADDLARGLSRLLSLMIADNPP